MIQQRKIKLENVGVVGVHVVEVCPFLIGNDGMNKQMGIYFIIGTANSKHWPPWTMVLSIVCDGVGTAPPQ